MTMGIRSSKGAFIAVSACFLLSGFAALLYQIAWMRQLSTVFGTSELAVATILAAYMAGLAFGAAVAARVMHRIRRPILVYAILEASIALSAMAVPFLLQLAGIAYAAMFGGLPQPPDATGMGQTMFYLGITFLVLAVPTACMGATLPMVTRYAVHKDEEVGPRVGLLYSINTAGAIGGTLVAALVLLPVFGLWGTILTGAAINLVVFVVAALLARSATVDGLAPVASKPEFGWRPESWILPVMLFSGVTTFMYEVLWTRLLSHILGGSVVAFATMLASFLAGIAIGSAVASRIATTRNAAQRGFIITELGIAVMCTVIYLALDQFVPGTAGLRGNIPVAIGLLLPATLFIGATFPFAVRILSRDESEAPTASARIYSWNTIGAILGALIAGFFVIPVLKYEGAIKLAVSLNAGLALVAALVLPPRRSKYAAGAAALLAVLVLLFSPQAPESLLRVSPLNDLRTGDIRYYDVGRSATVLVLERDGYHYLRTNGLSEAAADLKGAPPSRRSQRLLATMPVLARPGADSMLIVGFGGGVVAEDIPASISEIDIVELEPKVLEANRSIAAERNINPFEDSRIRLVVNDARNALRLTSKKYDAIVSQPSHPWTAGASHLYTREFMDLVKSRLNDEGVFLQWMNTSFVSEAILKSLAATLLDVFPHVRVYHFESTVLFFLASDSEIEPEAQILVSGEPLKSQPEEYKRRGFGSVNDLVAALAWDDAGLRKLASGAPLITDNDNLMAMNSGAAFENNALPYSRLQQLMTKHGSVFDPGSEIHNAMAPAVDFLYVIDRLELSRSAILSKALADVLLANQNPASLLLGAKYLQTRGQDARADQLLQTAMTRNRSNPVAAYLLFKSRGAALVDGSVPQYLRPYLGGLSAVGRAVIECMEYALRGELSVVRNRDDILARARPFDQWYLDAAKLRADWRIRATSRGETRVYAAEALSIIDEVIALRRDINFYGMRMAAAFLADDHDAAVETARRMVWVIREDMMFRAGSPGRELSASEASSTLVRLDSMQTGLAEVRKSGRIADYKFATLDKNISELRQTVENNVTK